MNITGESDAAHRTRNIGLDKTAKPSISTAVTLAPSGTKPLPPNILIRLIEVGRVKAQGVHQKGAYIWTSKY